MKRSGVLLILVMILQPLLLPYVNLHRSLVWESHLTQRKHVILTLFLLLIRRKSFSINFSKEAMEYHSCLQHKWCGTAEVLRVRSLFKSLTLTSSNCDSDAWLSKHNSFDPFLPWSWFYNLHLCSVLISCCFFHSTHRNKRHRSVYLLKVLQIFQNETQTKPPSWLNSPTPHVTQ